MFSPDGTLVSVSAAPPCGGGGGERERETLGLCLNCVCHNLAALTAGKLVPFTGQAAATAWRERVVYRENRAYNITH